MTTRLVLVSLLVLLASGCATTKKEAPLVSRLQLRVGELERELRMAGYTSFKVFDDKKGNLWVVV